MLYGLELPGTVLLDGDGDETTVLPHSGSPGGRFVSDAQLALLTDGTAYAIFARVKIEDAAGTMRNYQNRNPTSLRSR